MNININKNNHLDDLITWMISLMLCAVVFCCKYSRISAEIVFHLRAYSDTVSTNANVPFAYLHNKNEKLLAIGYFETHKHVHL